MVPGAEPSVGQPRGSHLALQYPPAPRGVSFYYYWLDETSFFTFGSAISWWDL